MIRDSAPDQWGSVLERVDGEVGFSFLGRRIRGVVWDWGDTLMRDFPGQEGPMVDWPRVEAMPGAREALEACSRFGLQCVASNASESSGDMIAGALQRVGLGGFLTLHLTSAELGTAKPDPAFFERTADALGFPPQELLAIGNDLKKDILPARALGYATVLVSGEEAGGRTEERADLQVPDLGKLAALIRDHPGG